MKLFCRREVQGAISLFLVAIMLPMMVISALMVDTARYQLAKSMVASAGDLALNGALADYDAILKDVYGLFAMSQVDDIEKNVREYFEQTVVSYGVVGEEDAGEYVGALLGKIYEYLLVDDKQMADFLNMVVDESKVQAEKVKDSSLANPQMLEKQIVEFMKYRAPVDFGLSFLDSLSAFTKVEAQTDVVQAQVNAQSSLQDASDANYALYKAVRAYDEKYNELEPSPPPDRVYLKNYGHIFTVEYVEEYEKLHQMTMIFCCAAYRGMWELPDSNMSTSGFFLLGSGDYIVQDGENLKVAGHLKDTNTSFGQYSSGPLEQVKSFLENDAAGVKEILAGYGTQKINNPSSVVSDEANWGTVVSEFQEVDSFYKENWTEYAAAVKKLDECAAAMEAYVEKIGKEIADLQKQKSDAEKKEKEATDKRTELSTADANAGARLEGHTAQEREGAQSYRANEEELKKLESLPWAERAAQGDKINSLKEQNQGILAEYGEETIGEMVSDLDTQAAWTEQYGDLNDKISEAKNAKEEYEGQIETKETQKRDTEKQYQDVLNACRMKVNFFSNDAHNYKAFKKAMKDVIGDRALKVSMEFKGLYANVKQLEQLLAEVETKFGEAESAIHTYTENVESWSDANDNYAAGEADNFSEVQSSGIKEAENVFSQEQVQEFPGKVQKEHEKLKKFLEELDANFVYMGKSKIEDITNAQQIADAIQGSGAGSSINTKYVEQKAEVSMAECGGFFELTHDMDGNRLNDLAKLTEPAPCCAFMNYLHQTYQEKYGVDELGRKEEHTEEEESANKAYNETKSNDIAKGIENSAKVSGRNFGYTYEKVSSIGGAGYPSGESAGSGGSEEKNGSADKDGLAENKSAASNMLAGLGNAIENGRDKLYVMAYLFDNFSYNTLVQDRVREDGKKPSWIDCRPEMYAEYVNTEDGSEKKPAAYTAGEYMKYAINAKNNPIYGAEIEYVLYGAKKPSSNVLYAQASIYAVRVLFNAVYAFTSSDIRNQTRVVAMAVQAATCGVVPYQVVQVVMQLALAMGEAAIDMANMDAGAKVAVVKSKETWTLSMDGLANLAKGAFKTAAGTVVGETTKLVQNKISEIVDAGADKLSKCVEGVEKDLETIAGSAAEEILDNAFARIDAVVDEVMKGMMDELFYSDGSILENMDPESVRGKIEQSFALARQKLGNRITEVMKDMAQGSDNPLLSAACEEAGKLANDALDEIQKTFNEEVNKVAGAADLKSFAYKQLDNVKLKISEKVKAKYQEVLSSVSTKVQEKINDVTSEIQQKANEKTEEAKEAVTKKINDFVDDISFGNTKMDTGGLSGVNNNAADSSTKASAIAFGYSDYLRLFLFIGLCADNQSGDMIRRIGDLIQLNLSSASGDSPLTHGKGSGFAMSNAMTYMSLDAEVDLDLMFLNFGIFRRQVESFNEEYEEENRIDLGETLGIRYLGIVGY